MFRKERYPDEWPAIRAGVLMRACNMCERCFAPNGEAIIRGEGIHAETYMLPHGEVFCAIDGERLGMARGSEYDGRFVKVVLTVAHLDHVEHHNDPSNLAAMCQRCHLNHDRADNARRRKVTKRDAREAESTQEALFPREETK